MTEFDRKYIKLVKKIYTHGIVERDERTGHESKKLFGEQLVFNLAKEFPLLTLRKIPLKIFIAEQVWFISGSKRPDDFLQKFTKIWDDFTEKDGTVGAAYGYRWRKHFQRDQLFQLIEHLKQSPHSRQALVMMWDPADDGLYGTNLIGTYKKNAPCPFGFAVNVIKNKFHMHLFIRSSDIILGAPHDIAGFALLQYILAAKLGYKPGKLVVALTNVHIWDNHFEQIENFISRTNSHLPIKFIANPDYFDRAEKKDETLVEEIFTQIKSQYHPLDKIEGLKIVL